MKNIFTHDYTSIEELQKDTCLFLSECGFITLIIDNGIVISKSPAFTITLTFDLKHKKYYIKFVNTSSNSEYYREYNNLSDAITSIALHGRDVEFNEHIIGLVYKYRTIKRLLLEGFVITNLAYYCSDKYMYNDIPLLIKHNNKSFILYFSPSGEHWFRYIVSECTSKVREHVFQIKGLIERIKK